MSRHFSSWPALHFTAMPQTWKGKLGGGQSIVGHSVPTARLLGPERCDCSQATSLQYLESHSHTSAHSLPCSHLCTMFWFWEEGKNGGWRGRRLTVTVFMDRCCWGWGDAGVGPCGIESFILALL